MRESRVRGIERKIEREKSRVNGRRLLMFLVLQLNGEGQREEVPWNWHRCQ